MQGNDKSWTDQSSYTIKKYENQEYNNTEIKSFFKVCISFQPWTIDRPLKSNTSRDSQKSNNGSYTETAEYVCDYYKLLSVQLLSISYGLGS